MNDPLLQYRDRFPILSRTKYLVSHSLGAMPELIRQLQFGHVTELLIAQHLGLPHRLRAIFAG